MAWFLFNEKLTVAKVIGGGLILAAIALTAVGERRTP
jgi:drug/metabolite transporter (DMT)-like permease